MLLEFRLTMPGVGSWNGKWTGSENYYARVINFTKKYGSSKKAKEKLETLDGNSFYYNFGDGWSASIDVRVVTSTEARQIRKKSRGFYGYEWMIDSILSKGEICTK